MKYLFPSIWLGLIVFASLTPSAKIPNITLFPHADKVIHFCMYLGLSFLLIPPLTIRKNYKHSFIFSFMISVLIGFLMEYFQYLFAMGRSAELFDFFANMLGTIAGIYFYQILIRNKRWERKIFRIE
jgi:VanZ family protein